MDHLLFSESMFVNKDYILGNEVEAGDEVFIVGLFRHHHGSRKNLPIIRIGNIAAMDEEKIQTKFHLMDGYLIEARSIGGLSGSPVFTNLGWERAFSPVANPVGDPVSLLGLIYGHYDIENDDKARINTGIAIVTPVSKLIELFNQPEIVAFEKGLLDEINLKVNK